MSLRLIPNSGHCFHLRRNTFMLNDNLRSLTVFSAPKHNPSLSLCADSTIGNHFSKPNEPPPMEVELKLRLADSSSHQKLSDLLSSHHVKTHKQQNIFFDGANAELSSNLAVLRIRFYDDDSHCILSLKAKPKMSGGISRIEEHEEPLEPSIGRACVAEPNRLQSIESSRILERVRAEYRIGREGFVCLGGFSNVRRVYEWKGLKLELDETNFDFGTNYEIECESEEPERVKELLEGFLKEKGIDYSFSKTSKFAIFRSGKLPQF